MAVSGHQRAILEILGPRLPERSECTGCEQSTSCFEESEISSQMTRPIQIEQKLPPRQGTDKSVLLDAIDITLRTIEDRARLYRNLVVGVSVVSVLSILLAVLFRQWVALTGLVLLVPLTGGFLFIDSRRIRHWRAEILERFLMRGLDLTMFRKTISGFGHLPTDSLQAMLSTIPSNENTCPQEAREQNVIGDEFDTRTRKNEWRMLSATSLLTLALVCLAGAAVYQSLILQLCGAGLMTLFALLRRR